LKKRRSEDILILCGERLKALRKERGLTQEGISDLLRMDFSQYGKIERGQTNITLSTLNDIANALEVPVAELLNF
jgi:transcriptional regulator with XRE-family HTH domain